MPNSASNLEIARDYFAAYVDGRDEDLLEFLSPNVVFEPELRPGLSVYHGHSGARFLFQELRRTPNGGRSHFEGFAELPDGRIEAHGHQILADGTVGPKACPTITIQDSLIVHVQGWSAADER
jgi:hypothetical protein